MAHAQDATLSRFELPSDQDEFRPRRPAGMTKGALFAMAAHVALVVALAFGVSWQNREPEVLSAELWAPTPQQAAPAPVAAPEPPQPAPQVKPEPPVVKPPVEADIAMQREREAARRAEVERREREQQDKLRKDKERKDAELREKEKARKEAEAQKLREAKEAKEAAAAEARLAKQRDDQLKRMQAMAGASGSATATGAAAQDAAPSAEYGGRIKARIKPNIVFTEGATGNPVAEVEVRVAPTGRIVGRRLTRASGNKAWDEAVLRAIDRTEMLPRDVDGRVPPAIVIEFRPNE